MAGNWRGPAAWEGFVSEVPRTWGHSGPGVYAEWGRKTTFLWRVTESSAEEAAFQLGPWDLNSWNPRKGHFQRQEQDRQRPGSGLSCRAPQSRAERAGAVMEEGEPWCQSGLSANLGDTSRPPAALWLQWVDGLDSNPASTHGGLHDLRRVSETPRASVCLAMSGVNSPPHVLGYWTYSACHRRVRNSRSSAIFIHQRPMETQFLLSIICSSL